MRRRAWAGLVVAVACSGPERAGSGLPGGPLPPLAAHPVGQPSSLVIGAVGGSLSLGNLTVTIPAGAVSADTDFTIAALDTNTAIGASGTAYELGPPGATLALPATLEFAVADSTGLAASHQLAQLGYWLRSYHVTTTPTAVSVVTSDLGDWTLITVATQRDLHGPFRLSSTTQDVPFTATGDVTLQFLGEEPGFVYYLPTGTVTPSAAGCDGVPPAPLPFSLAEIHAGSILPLQFRWAVNGYWTLNCSRGSHPFVSMGFDTMGINNHGCALDYTAAMTVFTDPGHLSGQYSIVCPGTRGSVIASWDLVLPAATPGPLPPP